MRKSMTELIDNFLKKCWPLEVLAQSELDG
jgi:hypothetical protein